MLLHSNQPTPHTSPLQHHTTTHFATFQSIQHFNQLLRHKLHWLHHNATSLSQSLATYIQIYADRDNVSHATNHRAATHMHIATHKHSPIFSPNCTCIHSGLVPPGEFRTSQFEKIIWYASGKLV